MPGDEPKQPTEPPVQHEQPSEGARIAAGAALGFLFGGPIGAVGGAAIGSFFGTGVARSANSSAPGPNSSQETPPVAPRSYEDLAREMIEFEKQFPPPEQDEIFADARWFEARWGKPEFEPYRGTCIAVLNGAIVGHGWNSLQLQLDMARKFNVHPQRFIIEYIPPREF